MGWSELTEMETETDLQPELFCSSFLLISRYVPPVTTNYYEGTGFSKVLIDKKYPILLISMSLHSRSENGLIAYLGSKVEPSLTL